MRSMDRVKAAAILPTGYRPGADELTSTAFRLKLARTNERCVRRDKNDAANMPCDIFGVATSAYRRLSSVWRDT